LAAWLTHLTPDIMEWLPVPPVNTAAARAAEEASGSHSPRMVALLAVCLGFFVIQLDVTIVNVALPAIQHEIGGTVGGLQWVVDSYTLACCSTCACTAP
jgi:DHA2 family methylenomycin A resistance protein-like MFS transporter